VLVDVILMVNELVADELPGVSGPCSEARHTIAKPEGKPQLKTRLDIAVKSCIFDSPAIENGC
jgi:hypothetical protein